MIQLRRGAPFLLALMFILTSCGDLFMKSKSDDTISTPFATCSLDTEALAQIFSKNIEGDIICLEENLNLFIRVVKTDRPGNLSLKELKKYIANQLPHVDEETISALEAIFEINSLLTGDDRNYIRGKNVQLLVDLFIDINKTFVQNNLLEFFQGEEVVSFEEHNRRKAIIYHSLKHLSESLGKVHKENSNSLDVESFVSKFSSEKNAEVLENIKMSLIVKKLILGEGVEKFTAVELKRLISIMADVGKVLFDIMNLPKTKGSLFDDEEVLNALKEGVETLKKNFYFPYASLETVFSLDDLKSIIEEYFPKYARFLVYEKEILEVKYILLNNRSSTFSVKDVYTLIDEFVLKYLEKALFFYRTYYAHENYYVLPERLLGAPTKSHYRSQIEYDLRRDFDRILKNYKFFKGSLSIPYYTSAYRRNIRGMVEVVLLEDIVTKFFSVYGEKDSSVFGNYFMNLELLEKLMISFEGLLEGEGVITEGRAKSTASTIALVTSLFQTQSNGDAKIEVPEFVEFAITMFSSIELTEEYYKVIEQNCTLDEEGRFSQQCFNENFLDFISSKADRADYSEHFSGLVSFLEKLDDNEYSKYFDHTATFSRTCTTFNDGTSVPMSKNEMIIMWAGLLNVEQSFIRFDEPVSGSVLQADNHLDDSEVRAAYPIFEQAIQGMLPHKKLEKLSKLIFFYLVKYKKVPNFNDLNSKKDYWRLSKEVGHLLKFMIGRGAELIPFMPKMKYEADRMTFAAVLELIQQNTPEEGPPFDCETLR